jgi:predicted secreted hydrolase
MRNSLLIVVLFFLVPSCFFKEKNKQALSLAGSQQEVLKFPADHLPHPALLTEWWYFNGHLESSDKKKFSYGFCLFRASPVYYFAHLSLTDLETGEFIFDRIFYAPAKVQAGKNEKIISYNNEQVIEISGSHKFHIKAKWKGIALDLELEQSKPPLLVNGNAKIDMPEGGASAYYSLTRMTSRGELSKGKKKYTVNGLSWMDHQWGNYFVKHKGWDWFSLQLDDSTEYNFYSFRNVSGKILRQYANVIDADNKPHSSYRIDIEKINTWKNRVTGRTFVTQWKLILPERKDTFYLAAIHENQEIFAMQSRDFFPSYWEGPCAVEKHTADRRIVYGKAFSEHFPVLK